MAIASRLEAIGSRFEASRFEAIATKVVAIASRLEAIATRLVAIASRLEAIAVAWSHFPGGVILSLEKAEGSYREITTSRPKTIILQGTCLTRCGCRLALPLDCRT